MNGHRAATEESLRLQALQALALQDGTREERYDRHTRLLQHIFESDIAIFTLLERNRVIVKSGQGIHLTEFPRAHSFCACVVEQRNRLVVEDVAQDSRFAHPESIAQNAQIGAYAGAPVCDAAGYCIGALSVAFHHPKRFASIDLEALDMLAKMVESDLQWSNSETIDPLTYLCNKPGFINAAKHVLALCNRLDQQATMVFFDVLDLEDITRRYGVETRDLLVIGLGKILYRTMRSSDVIGRHGENAFVALLPHGDNFNISSILKRLMQSVNQFNESFDVPDLLTPRVSYLHYDQHNHKSLEAMLTAQNQSVLVETRSLLTNPLVE